MAYDPDLEPIFQELRSSTQVVSAQLQEEKALRDTALQQLAAMNETLRTQLKTLTDRVAAIEEKLKSTTTPVPTPTPTPTVTPIWSQLKQTQLSYPTEIVVPPGTKDFYIPMTADHTDRESFYCYVSGFTNISGGNINVGNSASQRSNFSNWENVVYRWSPGDDLTHWIKVSTNSSYSDGKFFGIVLRIKGLGDKQKGRSVRVTFSAAAEPQPIPPATYHRPLRRLNLSKAVRKNTFDPATVKHHDSGFINGQPVWRSRLSHGYSQDGNQETGLYMNEDKFPGVAQSPITYDDSEKAVRLHTLAFPMDKRAEFDNRLFRHQAVMLQGQTLNEVCGTEGVWRMEAKIPIRRYSWPAFWLAGRGSTGAKGSWTQWPPEIDILEKFNYAWGAADTPYTTTFGQHFGKVGSNTRVGAFGNEIEVNQWSGVTKPLDEEYHSWACAVTYHADPKKCEVTFFFDDVEVGCHVLHARHEDMVTKCEFFPMVNVAVKANSTYTPEQYNTDDGRGRTGDMLLKDVAYYPSGFTYN